MLALQTRGNYLQMGARNVIGLVRTRLWRRAGAERGRCGAGRQPPGWQPAATTATMRRRVARVDVTEKSITGPPAPTLGEAEITLTNDGKNEADLGLIRGWRAQRSAAEVVQGLAAAMRGKAFPGLVLRRRRREHHAGWRGLDRDPGSRSPAPTSP